MRTTRRSVVWMLTVGLALVVSGCGGTGTAIKSTVRQAVGDERIRVAVLPLDNLSQKAGADRAVTQVIVTYLLASDLFEVVEPGHVNRALLDLRIRSATEEVDPATARKLGETLDAELLLIGAVQEYGEVRVASDTYPAVSLSARLLDAYSGAILWSASVSQTGADTVVIFDIGRITSLPKLTQVVVEKLTASLQEAAPRVLQAVKAGREARKTAMTAPPAAPAPPPAPPIVTAPTRVVLTQEQLTGLLREVPGFVRAAVEFSKHFYASAQAAYEGDRGRIQVRLVDYTDPAQAKQVMASEHAGQSAATFGDLPGYVGESQFGLLHLDIVAGRFGLYLSGAPSTREHMERLAQTLLGGLADIH